MIIRSLVISIIILLLVNPIFGQKEPTPFSMDSIEAAITRKSIDSDIWNELNINRQWAIQHDDDGLYARTIQASIQLKDIRTEDSLYFQNSAILDTLITKHNTSPKLKAILHILLAKRLQTFAQHRKFNILTYRSNKIPTDYASFSNIQRDSIIKQNYVAALKISTKVTKASSLLWLLRNPEVLLFKPELKDIVMANWIEYLNFQSSNLYKYQEERDSLLLLPSQNFFDQLSQFCHAYKDDKEIDIFRRYIDWIQLHADNAEETAYLIALTRAQLYNSDISNDKNKAKRYLNFLNQEISSPYNMRKAYDIAQSCKILYELGNQYLYVNYSEKINIQDECKSFLSDALHLYGENKDLVHTFPTLEKILQQLSRAIKSSKASVYLKHQLLPGKDIPIKVLYKNTDTIYYQVAATSIWEEDQQVYKKYKDLNIQNKGAFKLPPSTDYNQHAVYLKIPALKAGHYRLFFSASPLDDTNDYIYSVPFVISNIAVMNNHEKIFVLDQGTGQPLTGARIHLVKNGSISKKFKEVKQSGAVEIDRDIKQAKYVICYQSDTLSYDMTSYSPHAYRNGDTYNKDDYDNLSEYYDDQLEIKIFTDRGIYRPGQEVQFKAIFLVKNPTTGQTMIATPENLGKAQFRKFLNEVKSYDGNLLQLMDPFNNQVDSIVYTINDFGSFHGSFKIPKNAATGEWHIDCDYSYIYGNGNFQVEAYKRPSLDISIKQPTKYTLPGEAFEFKINVRSLSGAKIDNTPIHIQVSRSGNVPKISKVGTISETKYSSDLIRNDTLFTNAAGTVSVKMLDSFLSRTALPDSVFWNYNYQISATAIDKNGESADAIDNFSISSLPISIKFPVNSYNDIRKFSLPKLETHAAFEGKLYKKVHVQLYKIHCTLDAVNDRMPEVDQWYFSPEEWYKWFPEFAKDSCNIPDELIYETTVDLSNASHLDIPPQLFSVGRFKLKASVRENGRTIGQENFSFTLFDLEKNLAPAIEEVHYLKINLLKNGDTITWYHSGKKDRYAVYQIDYYSNKKKRLQTLYQYIHEKEGLYAWQFKIPTDVSGGQMNVSRHLIQDQIYQNQFETIYLNNPREIPEIIIEKYRQVMVPGAKEVFQLSVKSDGKNVASELLTTLYDASLDKLSTHKWEVPNTNYRHSYNAYNHWTYPIKYSQFIGGDMDFDKDGIVDISSLLNGMIPGLQKNYSVSRMNATAAGIVQIRGGAMPGAPPGNGLVILDGDVYKGRFDKFEPGYISDVIILKGAEATALYGSRASNGVILLSTKGKVKLPKPEEQPVKIRKNFNETAFFFPNVYADKDGYYTLQFSMPESATEWNWKMLAHTKKSAFAYLERKLQSRLNLMIQPNMPRLLYQGDQIWLQSRISNLDSLDMEGYASCTIEDAVTGKDLTGTLLKNFKQDFRVEKRGNTYVSFNLKIPNEQTNPLKIILSARSGSIGDAEEHIIPVLNTNILVKQGQTISLSAGTASIFKPISLPANASLYGANIAIQPQPPIALLNALPWLAHYSYNCAEQTFNKFRARYTAYQLMRADTLLQNTYEKASSEMRFDSSVTAAPRSSFTAPWLSLTNQSNKQAQDLIKILDTLDNRNEMEQLLGQLKDLQNADGGLSWFKGGVSNRYISNYILAGFGQMKNTGKLEDILKNKAHMQLLNSLIRYCLNEFEQHPRDQDIYLLYTLSYWKEYWTTMPGTSERVNTALDSCWKHIAGKAIDVQAQLVTATMQISNTQGELRSKAFKQLDIIQNLAISDENGTRWKAFSDNVEMQNTSEENLASIFEAIRWKDNYKELTEGVSKWLLQNRQQEHWQTTKATAAAIRILNEGQGKSMGEEQSLNVQLEQRQFHLSDHPLYGHNQDFIPLEKLPDNFSMSSGTKATTGIVTWYYFLPAKDISPGNTGIQIHKSYYKSDGQTWIPIQDNTLLKTGDKIKVSLEITTEKTLKFVHIFDPRLAAFEPGNVLSGYRYGQSFGYYQSNKDNGVDIFVDQIERGQHHIDYEMKVAQNGTFSCGPTQLECMYQPWMNAYGQVSTFSINPQNLSQ
ncbi:hypothetical protein COR50_17975 [Chitinophaga caeni]|uniref:Alpha-2-macroglobulin domain-containing protein n=1 Tax=Chitinophaga caeni TaxID=2029983 RepID=A0A291QYF6_9BACT|nr:MG2 domain-containing protein [Chitinophaga caeni]ATL48903.1 hypothetical protein COR50_17975 [Chitinophaga caeni]